MKNYKYWESCIAKIEANEIEKSINYGIEIAKKLKVPKELIAKIFSVNLKSFEKRIDSKMNESIKRAKLEDAKALCLYYSLDNGWDCTMYICKNYTKENSNWISESRSWVDLGRVRGFSGIYKKENESAFFADDLSSGIPILLMLRTTIAFYNVAKGYKNCGLKICITATEYDFVRVL